ncbi:MAG: hypothetical protein HZB38_18200 [Planctomycetes bacterium]|nr:hypothetical protein [Planctomycetota bacterium]
MRSAPHSGLARFASHLGWAWLLAAVVSIASGCSGLAYERARLGLTPGEVDRQLNLTTARRTENRIIQYQRDSDGEETSLVFLLANDRRLAGKVMVERRLSSAGFLAKPARYSLVGELDRALYGVDVTGPIDTLRLITQQLRDLPTEAVACNGQKLVLAGLVRILQGQRNVEDLGVSADQLSDLATIAPEGCDAQLSTGADAVVRFGYRVEQVR